MNKIILMALSLLTFSLSNTAYAADLGSISDTVLQLLGGVSQILDVIAWVSGAGFAVSALVKYKEHRARPQSIPLSGPITEMIVAIILIAFPFIMKATTKDSGHPETTSYLEGNLNIGLLNDSYHQSIIPPTSTLSGSNA